MDSLLSGDATPAVHRKLALLGQLSTRQIAGNGYGMLFYLAFMLLPVLIFLIPALLRFLCDAPKTLRIGVVAALCPIVLSGLVWFGVQHRPAEYLPSASYHKRMPYLLNVLYDTGLGPVTLDPDYFGPPPTPIYPVLWWVVTGIVAVAAAVSAGVCIFGLLRPGRCKLSQKSKPVLPYRIAAFFFLATFEILFSHLQEWGLFDRHILIVAFPFSLLIGIAGNEGIRSAGVAERRRLMQYIPAGIAIAFAGAFSVAATHDYMRCNRIRWELGRGLLAQGVDPLTIVGGFEFNAWHNHDGFVARRRIAQTEHWWYDRRDYVVSMNRMDGYEVRLSREYFSWVHRPPMNIYVMRNSKSETRRPFSREFLISKARSGFSQIPHEEQKQLNVFKKVYSRLERPGKDH